MEYLLMIFRSEAETHKMSPEQTAQLTAAYGAYAEALGKAGVMRGGNRLRDVETATTVRVREGKTEVLNGPYAETREQLPPGSADPLRMQSMTSDCDSAAKSRTLPSMS